MNLVVHREEHKSLNDNDLDAIEDHSPVDTTLDDFVTVNWSEFTKLVVAVSFALFLLLTMFIVILLDQSKRKSLDVETWEIQQEEIFSCIESLGYEYECTISCEYYPEPEGIEFEEERRSVGSITKPAMKVAMRIFAPFVAIAISVAKFDGTERCREENPSYNFYSEVESVECALLTRVLQDPYSSKPWESEYFRREDLENLGCEEIFEYIENLIFGRGGLKNRHWEFARDYHKLLPFKAKTIFLGRDNYREIGSIYSHVEVYCRLQDDLQFALKMCKCYGCDEFDSGSLKELEYWATEPPPASMLRKVQMKADRYCDDFVMLFQYDWSYKEVFCGDSYSTE